MNTQRAAGFIRIIVIASILIILGGLGARFLKSIKEKVSPSSNNTATTTQSTPQTQPQVGQAGGDVSTSPSSTGTTKPPTTTASYEISKSGDYERNVPGWNARSYLVHTPSGYDGTKPFPVLIAIHGGGGNAAAQLRLTCPDGNLSNSKCMNALADRSGFIVVYPNGTVGDSFLAKTANSRTWNAGGGTNGYACVSKYACENKIDDIGYFRALLTDLEKATNVNTARIYATGISNGGAMSHRLACQLSDKITAIATVGGENQFSAVTSCSPARAIPTLIIHGTADPAWPYNTGNILDLTPGQPGGGIGLSTDDSVNGWVKRNGCTANPTAKQLPNVANDGTSVETFMYGGCRNSAEVVLYKIVNGGHTWPQGYRYLSKALVGEVSQQFNANEVIWNFVKQFSK